MQDLNQGYVKSEPLQETLLQLSREGRPSVRGGFGKTQACGGLRTRCPAASGLRVFNRVSAHKGRQDCRQHSNRRTYSPSVGVINPTAISVLLHVLTCKKHDSDISTVSGPKRKKTCTLRLFEDIHCIIVKLFTNSVLMFFLSHFSQESAALLEITLSELWNQ